MAAAPIPSTMRILYHRIPQEETRRVKGAVGLDVDSSAGGGALEADVHEVGLDVDDQAPDVQVETSAPAVHGPSDGLLDLDPEVLAQLLIRHSDLTIWIRVPTRKHTDPTA